MGFIGPVVKGVRGLAQTVRLPSLIQDTERDLARPLRERFEGHERYEAMQQLAEARYVADLREGVDPLAAGDAFAQELWEEYNMAKEDLESSPASKADVAEVAIALKELAVTLDRHVTNAYEKADALGEEFRVRSSAYLEEIDRWMRAETGSRLDQIGDRFAAFRQSAEGELREVCKSHEAAMAKTLEDWRLAAADELKVNIDRLNRSREELEKRVRRVLWLVGGLIVTGVVVLAITFFASAG